MDAGIMAILSGIGGRLVNYGFSFLTSPRNNPVQERIEHLDKLIQAIPEGEIVERTTAPVVQNEGLLPSIMTETSAEEKAAADIATACVPCAIPTTLVFSNPGVTEIRDIKVGEKVLDARGKFSTVTRIWEREYNGEVILVTLPYQKEKLVLTPEHPVLAIKGHHCGQLRYKGSLCFPKDNPRCSDCALKRNYQPEFVPVGELSTTGVKGHWVQHIVLLPILKVTKDVKEVRVSKVVGIGFERLGKGLIKPVKKNAHNRSRTAVAIKDTILVNDAFMALAGFYLSEGSVNLQARGGQTRFDFSSEEKDYASEVKNLLMDVFGVQATISPNSPSTIRVLVSSVLLARFFLNLFGKGALDKHMPQWMLTLPHAKQRVLIEKYWRGDGSQWVNGEETQTQLSVTTASRSLAYSLRLILHRLGFIHSLSKYTKANNTLHGRVIKSNGYEYVIQVHPPAAIRLAEMLNFPIPQNWRFLQSHQAGIDENWVYLPVKKVERKLYKGSVMNLTTEPDNTYTIGIAVHNCAIGHFSTSSGLLKEAVRFKGEGITSNEILDRIAGTLEEQNALEREDLSPEKIERLPEWERAIAEEALSQSRELRHKLENIQTIEELEQVAADTKRYYIKLTRQWYKGRFGKLGAERAEAIVQRVGEN